MKIIFSRVNDAETHSKKWVIGYALLFWLTTRILAVLMVVACSVIYESMGFTKGMFPVFGGVPTGAHTIGKLIYSLATVALIAPMIEELVFRLGLSFKKWQVALGLAFIPIFIGWSDIKSLTLISGIIYIVIAIAIYFAIDKFTTQDFWNKLRSNWLVAAMWITSIAFGLVHLRAFSFFSWEMLPYMLCMTASPFFCGCACAYLRVNLGFWWGLGMHIFSNIPGIGAILLMSI